MCLIVNVQKSEIHRGLVENILNKSQHPFLKPYQISNMINQNDGPFWAQLPISIPFTEKLCIFSASCARFLIRRQSPWATASCGTVHRLFLFFSLKGPNCQEEEKNIETITVDLPRRSVFFSFFFYGDSSSLEKRSVHASPGFPNVSNVGSFDGF